VTTDRDIPPYGPHVAGGKDVRYGPGHPANRRAEAILEVEALSQRFAAERAHLVRKHAADEAAEARMQEAARVAGEEALRRQDEELAPVKAQRRREYFIAHPSGSDAEFTRLWDRLRADEVATHREQQVERTIEALRRSGRYDGIL
jgi:flagellar hook-length control protein FliK